MQITSKQIEYSTQLLSVSGIPSDEIHLVWDEAREFLLKPLELSGGRLDEPSLLKALLKKEMQLWVAFDERIRGVQVTQIVIYPTGKKALSAILTGGENMDEWVHFWAFIEEWARIQGCEVSEIPRGRKGWTRMLKGWTSMVFMEKEI